MNWTTGFSAFALMVIASFSQAAIIKNGDTFTDTTTNTTYLDIRITRGVAWENVFAATAGFNTQTSNGYEIINSAGQIYSLEGYQYANSFDFDTLISSYGILPSTPACANSVTYCETGTIGNAETSALISIFGDTGKAAVGPSVYASEGDGFSTMLLADSLLTGEAYYAGIINNLTTNNDGVNELWTYSGKLDHDISNGSIGSLLHVRPSAVPLPAAGWLFVSALAGLIGRKKLAA
jgi:hypothetical protein